MPDINVYSTDPGKEVRTSQGSVINVVKTTERSPEATAGVSVLGVIGTPANDRGNPGVPVLLSSVQDISSRWGGFKACVGDGAAEGYNGNVAALLYKLLARRVVFQPVDMALKDKTISDATAVDLEISIARGALAFTVEADDDVFTCTGHGFAVNDTVQLVTLSGGTGAAVATTYHVIAPVVSGTSFKLSAAQGDASLSITLDGSGYLRPVSEATPDYDAFTLPAGSQIQTTGGGFIVRTLEDLEWGADEYAAQTVRVAKVSGTEAAINTVDEFVETHSDTSLIITTTATTVPDAPDAAEILLRYEAAIDALNVNTAGQSVTVLIADRTEAGVGDALSAHCSAAQSDGIFRVCVVAPPVGTSVTDAEGSGTDGVGRAGLNGEFAIYVHPGFRRRFPLDSDNLDAADDYKATFPGQALLAAKILAVRPEENPTYPDAEPFATYGVAELETVLTAAQKVTHFQAGICSAVFERVGGRRVGAYRDGIMADGTKIARKRLTDFLAASLIERATPWHKRLASAANQKGCFDACDALLADLKNPKDQRISDYELTASFDGETEEFTLQADVVELGNMDVITIRVAVTASGFSVLSSADA